MQNDVGIVAKVVGTVTSRFVKQNCLSAILDGV